MKTFLILVAGIAMLGTQAFSESPFACNLKALTPELRKRHFDEVGPKLRTLVKDIRELPSGYEFQFPADPTTFQLVAEWAAGEHACCPFFDIDLRLEREGGPFWLRLAGRDGVKPFIQSDFAKWFAAAKPAKP